ncbi:MAG: ABC transporter substrate-binding protein [Ignavibacteria bacterium]|nr:ABC transporter substrate-binding protein [Ignavibacteria bacterium]
MQRGKIFSKVIHCILFFQITVVLFSCAKPSGNIQSKFSVKDDTGLEVNFDSHPKRIISLGPNITETIYELGADSVLVGVTEYCDYPPQAKTKTNTGSYLSPDYEIISSLKPDLIIINVESSNNPTYQSLMNMGFRLFLSHARDLTGINKMISDIGKITGVNERADLLIKKISSELPDVTKPDSLSETALIIIAVNPLMTTNDKTFINEISELAGFRNIYAGEEQEYPVINYEDVVNRDPDVIIFPTDTLKTGKNSEYETEIRERIHNSGAVKSGNIIFIDDDIMFRPGPRITDAVKTLRNKYIRKELK